MTIYKDAIGGDHQAATLIVAASDSLHPERADYVCDGIDDQVQIQDANDAAIGGGVVCLEGTYNIDADLTLDGCKLIGQGAFSYPFQTSGGTIFNIADGFGVAVKGGGAIANCLLKVGATYTDTALTVDSYISGDNTKRVKFSKILDNIILYNSSYVQGTGILIKADASINTNAVDLSNFGPISVFGFEYGVKVYANEVVTKEGWFNGNHFESMFVYYSKYLVTFEAVGNAQIISNVVDVMQLQSSATTVDGLVLKSANSNTMMDNIVHGFRAWDWSGAAGGGNALRFEGVNTKRNVVIGYIYNYSDEGCNYIFNQKDDQGLVCPLDLNKKSFVNLLNNGGFDDGSSGWSPVTTVFAEETSIVKTGNKSGKLTANGVWAQIQQNLDDYVRYRGRKMTLGCWGYCLSTNDKDQRFRLGSGGGASPGYTESVIIPKDDAWHWTTVSHEMSSDATLVYVKLFVNSQGSSDVDDVMYIDGAILVEGDSCPAFSSKPITEDGGTAFTSSGRINHSDVFMDVLAVSATHIRSNEDLSAATPITLTIDEQPDVPRTLSWSFDSHAQITAYDMEIIGVDAKGNTVTETWDETAGWSGETNNAFATITLIKMTSRTGTGAADTMDIGITDVLGLSNVIYATGDVFKIKKNNENATVAGAQANATYDTYDMTVIGLGAGDDFTIWYKSNLNIIS